MKKLIAALTALSMLLLCPQVPAENAPMVFEQAGISMDFEDILDDSVTLADLVSFGILSHDPFASVLLLSDYAMPRETVYELNEQFSNAGADAQGRISELAMASYSVLAYVFVTDAKDPGSAIGSVLGELPEGTEIVDFGETDAFHYCEILPPLQEVQINYDDLAEFGIDAEAVRKEEASCAEDRENLRAAFTERLKTAELYAPVDPDAGLIGQTISFETTDLDGNPVTSADLFGDNAFTMVNLWGTWCINCVNETEELVRIHTRLQEEGCGVVGIEWEQMPIDTMKDEIRAFMEEKGMNYPSVIMPENNEIFRQVVGYPTTYFVDSTGRILAYPVVGANVGEYERIIEKLLAGEGTESETDAPDTPVSSGKYRVIVCDRDGHPVEGVTIQFCDDVICSFGQTDADGTAAFSVEEQKTYEVHVLQAPDGFAPDENIYHTQETFSDVQIVLEKAE